MSKVDEANKIYTEMIPKQDEFGKEWRKAVIAKMMADMNVTLSSAATMYNQCRVKAGGESTHRVPKQTVNAAPLEPVVPDPTMGQVFEIQSGVKNEKFYAMSRRTADSIAAACKGKITRRPELEGSIND